MIISEDSPKTPKPPAEDIVPMEGFFLLRRVPFQEMLKSSIIEIPEEFAARHKTQRGVLLRHSETEPLPFEIGDVLLVGRWAGTDISIDGDPDLFIVRYEEILGVIRT